MMRHGEKVIGLMLTVAVGRHLYAMINPRYNSVLVLSEWHFFIFLLTLFCIVKTKHRAHTVKNKRLFIYIVVIIKRISNSFLKYLIIWDEFVKLTSSIME